MDQSSDDGRAGFFPFCWWGQGKGIDMEGMSMIITYKKTAELVPYDKNAKLHDEKQIKNVANSISRFGWQQPIVIDENGVVVIGHCRLEAAKKLKLKEVPVTVASGLTEDEIKELRIADNKTNESPWELGLLAEDIEGLDFEGFDFEMPEAEPLFDYMANDDFIGGAENNFDTFTVSLEFNVNEKPEIDEYIKENGKTDLVLAVLKVVKGNA